MMKRLSSLRLARAPIPSTPMMILPDVTVFCTWPWSASGFVRAEGSSILLRQQFANEAVALLGRRRLQRLQFLGRELDPPIAALAHALLRQPVFLDGLREASRGSS